MATYNSEQLAAFVAPNYGPKERNRADALRRESWTYNTTDDPTGAIAEFDTIRLKLLPKGTRIWGGKLFFEAIGSNQVVDFGLEGADGDGTYDGTNSDDPDFITTAQVAVAAAGEAEFGVLQEDNPGYELVKDCYLTMTHEDTASTNAPASDKDIDGYVDIS